MTATAQIPNLDDAVGKACGAILALRPNAYNGLISGRYGDIITGWRGQLAVIQARLADECRSARLSMATGQALLDLMASEFETILDPKATSSAVGTTFLSRSTGTLAGGVIRKGTRFRRPANPFATPVAKQEGSYTVVGDTPILPGAVSNVPVYLVASRPGSYANILLTNGSTNSDIVASDPLFDTNLTTGTCSMGGGSDGYDEPAMKRIALAFAKGRFGPTLAALLAGALLGTGVRYAIVRENTTTAIANVYVADQSWGSSDRLAATVQQALATGYLGFGCRSAVLPATNNFVAVTATCILRDPNDNADTTPLDAAIRLAVRAYFDNRQDWDVWKAGALRAVIAKADRRILTCTSATVADYTSGAPYTDVTSASIQAGTPGVVGVHYYLADNALTVTYLRPS